MQPWNPPQDRPPAQWLTELPRHSEGAEIGVWRGGFTQLIYSIVQPKVLHLVDPWLFQPEFPQRMYGGKIARSQEDMDTIFAQVQTRFATQQPVIHRKFSSDALADFEDESLDWVYIDGNHYYEYVKADLEGYWHKLVPGGLLTGDDFMWGAEHGLPVQRAVREFLDQNTVDLVSAEKTRFILRKR